MNIKTLCVGIAALAAVSTMGVGCGGSEKAEAAASRAEAAADRASAAASRVEAAAQRAQEAAERAERIHGKGLRK